jgi:hypothetical protein
MVSLFFRFGERESNDEIDLVGLDGRDASALGNEGGNVLRCMMVIRFVFEER